MEGSSRCTVRLASINQISNPRTVSRKLLSKGQGEGVGVRALRSIGRSAMKVLDPFLLLDEFRADYPAGFPDHPHRGLETVTYMIKGALFYEEFNGRKGTIYPGGVQWVTAGRGIVHSEMSVSTEECHGIQLWVNLAKKDKMVPPSCQELESRNVPKVDKDGVKVSVIAGESLGVKSPIYTRTPTMFLDFTLYPGAKLAQKVPEGWNGFVYTLQGNGIFGEESSEEVGPHHILELSPGDGLYAWNKSNAPCKFLLIAGQPLNEPVSMHGPLAMNSREEIQETILDYQLGRNGFEKARSWFSVLGNRR